MVWNSVIVGITKRFLNGFNFRDVESITSWIVTGLLYSDVPNCSRNGQVVVCLSCGIAQLCDEGCVCKCVW